MFYDKKGNGLVTCLVCPRQCTIREGKKGLCRVRENRGGSLYAPNYGQVTAAGLDPIEKKPLYHFYPGSYILSFGSHGCNLRCGFCQNWHIAHGDPPTRRLEPRQVVELALMEKERGYPNIGVAYTYNEPFMWYEFIADTAPLVRQAGLKNVLVTNGYVNEKPLRELLPYIDAMNIDVKGFTEGYYLDQCGGKRAPVLRAVELACRECHVELTTLLVTDLNDSPEEIGGLVDWVAALDPDIPLHFSRYFPNYEFDLPPTPLKTLQRAREIALKKLSYVYIGNAPELDAGNTACPACGELLINRSAYRTKPVGLDGKKCRRCGKEIPIVG
jgi:pyruvate formate lyase activating enzyme